MRSTSILARQFGLLSVTVMVAMGLGVGCGKGKGDAGGSAGSGGEVAGRVSFTFDGRQYNGTTCIANSFPDENSTSITSGADESEWALMLEIPGIAAGKFTEADGATCSFIKPPFNLYDTESITITVSSHGKIGGAVEGSFSGTLVHQIDSTRKPITDGTFTAQRKMDVK